MHTFRRRVLPYLFLVPYGSTFCLFIVLPFIVSLVLAMMRFDLTSHAGASFIGLGNFKEAFTDQYFWKAVLATFSFVVLAVPSSIALSLALALGLHAMTMGRDVLRFVLFLPGMLNVAVAAILWGWFYNGEFGLFNHLLQSIGISGVPWLSNRSLAMPSVVLMNLWWTIGGSTVVLLAGLQQIPPQLWEAAAIDGASRWQSFRNVTLPMLSPVLFFMTVMNTIGAFQVFGQPFLLTKGGPELVTRGVVQYIYETAFNNYRLGYGAALSWMLFAMIAVFSILQRQLLRKVGE